MKNKLSTTYEASLIVFQDTDEERGLIIRDVSKEAVLIIYQGHSKKNALILAKSVFKALDFARPNAPGCIDVSVWEYKANDDNNLIWSEGWSTFKK